MATKTGPKKVKAAVLEPENNAELERFVGLIAAADREIAGIQADLERDVEELKEAAMAKVSALKAPADTMFEGVVRFCNKNRNKLLTGSKKSFEVPAGTIAWRDTPPSVRIKNAKEVIKRIKALGWDDHFLRVKEEVDRNAMLADPERAETIAGVEIEQYEELVLKCDDTVGLERTKKSKRSKKPK